MKATSILKAFIVIAVLSILCYVIHNNNKAADVNSLVNNPTEPYQFASRVDSICAKINNRNSFSDAQQLYYQLYEEIDVYAGIIKNDQETLLTNKEQNDLYAKAFETYYPKFVSQADAIFASTDWTPNKIRGDIEKCIDKNGEPKLQGITTSQTDTFKKYKRYCDGYNRFTSLLQKIEKCTNKMTYNSISELDNYSSYPYDNLQHLQSRKAKAATTAKNYWENYLINKKVSLKTAYQSIMNEENVTIEDIRHFNNLKTEWIDNSISYEETVSDAEDRFKTDRTDITSWYEKLAEKLSL